MAPRGEPTWLSRLVVDAIHADQLREHGGLAGVRDDDVLDSALARPRQAWHHRPTTDIPAVAAAYAFGLVKNHPYRDGNRRIGFLAMVTFLGVNGYAFDGTDEDVVVQFVVLAPGQVPEDALATWIRSRSTTEASPAFVRPEPARRPGPRAWRA